MRRIGAYQTVDLFSFLHRRLGTPGQQFTAYHTLRGWLIYNPVGSTLTITKYDDCYCIRTGSGLSFFGEGIISNGNRAKRSLRRQWLEIWTLKHFARGTIPVLLLQWRMVRRRRLGEGTEPKKRQTRHD